MKLLKYLKILQPIISIHFIMFFRFLNGFYYNLCSRKNVLLLGRIYIIFFNVVVITFSMIFTPKAASATYVIGWLATLIEYGVNAVLSFVTGEDYFQRFCSEIGVDFYKSVPKVTIIFFLSMAWKFLQLALNFSVFNGSFLLYLQSVACIDAIVIGCILSQMTRLMMYDLLWARVKEMRRSLRSKLRMTGFEKGNNHETKTKCDSVQDFLADYKRLYVNLKSASRYMNSMILLNYTASFARTVTSTYTAIQLFMNSVELKLILSHILTIVFLQIISVIPPIWSESVSSDVDKIKLLITKQFLVCRDEKYRRKLNDALAYIEICPLKTTILRTISVDLKLPFRLIMLCCTYLVVTIQFSHILD